MPIYEYRCLECGEVFSHLLLRSTDAHAQQLCSACGRPLPSVAASIPDQGV